MLHKYRELQTGEFIVVGGDTASSGQDYTAIQFISKAKIDVPWVFHARESTSTVLPVLVEQLNKIFDITGVKPMVALERQNGGTFILDRLAALNYFGKFDIYKMHNVGDGESGPTDRIGWDTNTATRGPMLSDLKNAIDSRSLRIYNKETINELFSFIIKNGKPQAESNSHDDLIMSLAIAWQLYQRCSPEVSSFDTSYISFENKAHANQWRI